VALRLAQQWEKRLLATPPVRLREELQPALQLGLS